MALSSAIGDIFGAIGDFQEAEAYGKASDIALQNEEITKQSTEIQQSQTQRQVYQALGSQVAAAGANNLQTSGSAADIMRSSAYQGALQKQLIGRQGLINENQFAAEAAAYQGMQSASKAAGISGIISAPFAAIGL